MRLRLLAVALSMVCLIGTGRGDLRESDSELRSDVLAMWSEAPGGHLALYILWADGTCVQAMNDPVRGASVFVGAIDPKRFTACADAVGLQSDFWKSNGTSRLVPHGPVSGLAAKLGSKQSLTRWDEVVRPCWGVNVNPDPAYRDFAAAWVRVKIELAAAFPCDTQVIGRKEELPAIVTEKSGCKSTSELFRLAWLTDQFK